MPAVAKIQSYIFSLLSCPIPSLSLPESSLPTPQGAACKKKNMRYKSIRDCHHIFVFIESDFIWFPAISESAQRHGTQPKSLGFNPTPAKDFPQNFMLIMPLSFGNFQKSFGVLERLKNLERIGAMFAKDALMQTDLRWLQEIKSPHPVHGVSPHTAAEFFIRAIYLWPTAYNLRSEKSDGRRLWHQHFRKRRRRRRQSLVISSETMPAEIHVPVQGSKELEGTSHNKAEKG